jgi:hypothetical protein
MKISNLIEPYKTDQIVKISNLFLFIGLIVLISLIISGYSGRKTDGTPERDRLFNSGWRFIRDSIPGAEKPEFDDSKWLVADRNKISTDRSDLSFVRIEITDINGQLIPRDSIRISLTLSGNGELAASGNTNPKDMASVNRPVLNTYKGKALAIIRPSGSGSVKILAESQNLKAGELIIQVTK